MLQVITVNSEFDYPAFVVPAAQHDSRRLIAAIDGLLETDGMYRGAVGMTVNQVIGLLLMKKVDDLLRRDVHDIRGFMTGLLATLLACLLSDHVAFHQTSFQKISLPALGSDHLAEFHVLGIASTETVAVNQDYLVTIAIDGHRIFDEFSAAAFGVLRAQQKIPISVHQEYFRAADLKGFERLGDGVCELGVVIVAHPNLKQVAEYVEGIAADCPSFQKIQKARRDHRIVGIQMQVGYEQALSGV